MNKRLLLSVLCGCLWVPHVSAEAPRAFASWTIYALNDTCPDYTWGNSEAQTRANFAELLRSHLDEMTRTDPQLPENQDRYNTAVTEEVRCFLERYPERKLELIQRIKQGRLVVSPFLCNSLWAFQSFESAVRTLSPARRLEREWGVPIDIAHHIEYPALPWGVPTILAGCGIRWVNIPFLDYDCTFGRLTNPPLFILEGPDGSRVRVVLDAWASRKANYTQAAHLLARPESITNEWLPHYLESDYPLNFVLASGTHGDTHADSAGQARTFAEQIRAYNARPGLHPKIVNASLRDFCDRVDAAQEQAPFLPVMRGCLGHGWDFWPVSLAKYGAGARQLERDFLAAETLIACAGLKTPQLASATRAERERAEWLWCMLSDHAWNGSNETNRKENARLRRAWTKEFQGICHDLLPEGWTAMGLRPQSNAITLFNSLGFPRAGIVKVPLADIAGSENPAKVPGKYVLATPGPPAPASGHDIPYQIVQEDGQSFLYFHSPPVGAFAFAHLTFQPGSPSPTPDAGLKIAPDGLENGFYRLRVDRSNGGIASLVCRHSGAELVAATKGRALGQTVFFDGREHVMTNAVTEVLARGPVLARLRVSGTIDQICITNDITAYAGLDRIDLDLKIHMPVAARQLRLCQLFPLSRPGAQLRVETTAAIIRPEPQPGGDLLPGADTRRIAVQGFIHVSVPGGGITVVPLDAFVLRRDLEPLTFEALGNDQNYKEVTRDQDGVTDFRFRYVLRANEQPFSGAEALWSREVATPLLAAAGFLPPAHVPGYSVRVDPARALVTCFKPADDPVSGGCILRLWELAGQAGPLQIGLAGFRRAWQTDLLERDIKELPLRQQRVELDLRARGVAGVRLLP